MAARSLRQSGRGIAKAASVASRLLRYCEVEIDAVGVLFRTLESHWNIGWGDVEAVLSGRETLTLAVAAISLPIPRSAFADDEEADNAFEQMLVWHQAAIAEDDA